MNGRPARCRIAVCFGGGTCEIIVSAPRSNMNVPARPLERQFWRARDVDLLELPLDDYADALARHVGLTEEMLA